METKEIIEGNELIALFMGALWGEHSKMWGIGKAKYIEVGKKQFVSAIEHHKPIDLKYNSEWNWLMPVVEKIESLEFGIEVVGNYCKVIGANIQCSQPTKLQATYKAVIEFIKWYNLNTKPNGN
jgi:hypothetical protein